MIKLIKLLNDLPSENKTEAAPKPLEVPETPPVPANTAEVGKKLIKQKYSLLEIIRRLLRS